MIEVPNHWQRLSSREVYRNPWIRVREDQVIRPDGQPGIYGVVEFKLGLGIVALDDRDTVWLLGQYRYPIDAVSWEIVNGTVEAGEAPLEAARRELAEEAELAAAEWIDLGRFHPSPGITNELAQLYLAAGLTRQAAAPEAEGTEEFVPKRVPWAECLAMIDRGDITDSYSVIALLKADRLRRSGGLPV